MASRRRRSLAWSSSKKIISLFATAVLTFAYSLSSFNSCFESKSNRLIAVRIDADREHDVVAAVHIDSGFHGRQRTTNFDRSCCQQADAHIDRGLLVRNSISNNKPACLN
jgi:hypothetical protein